MWAAVAAAAEQARRQRHAQLHHGMPSSTTACPAAPRRVQRHHSMRSAHLSVVHVPHDSDHWRPGLQVLQVLLVNPLCAIRRCIGIGLLGWFASCARLHPRAPRRPSLYPQATSLLVLQKQAHCHGRRAADCGPLTEPPTGCRMDQRQERRPSVSTAPTAAGRQQAPAQIKKGTTRLPSWLHPRAWIHRGPAHPRRSPAGTTEKHGTITNKQPVVSMRQLGTR